MTYPRNKLNKSHLVGKQLLNSIHDARIHVYEIEKGIVALNLFSLKRCCRGKPIRVTYSVCVSVALGIQHAMRICRVILSSLAPRTYHIFPHYLINGKVF